MSRPTDHAQAVYGVKDPSLVPKAACAAMGLADLAWAAWLLLGGGTAALGRTLGATWTAGDPGRRALLLACGAIYWTRALVTLFHLMKRAFEWKEALTIGAWMGVFLTVFALLGGTSPAPVDLLDGAGILLFLAGSALNTGSEIARDRWKRRPEHRGRLYTAGPFRWTMHPNYLGDLILFTGFALLTRSAWALLVPLAMLAGFVFVNVPMLDAYLRDRYGEEFERWEARTARLIPGVW